MVLGAEARDDPYVTGPMLSLRAFTRRDLRIVEAWFRDPDSRRFVGGPEWPRRMLELGEGVVGQEFRGAIQTGAYRYIAHADGDRVGYVDCGTFDSCTVYAGEGPQGPMVTESIEAATGSIAFVIDPQVRGRGVGRAMISALIHQPELGFVELFEAGVEPGNVASQRCLQAVGFRPGSEKPDFEGMLYYRAWRPELNADATLLA